MKEWIKDWWHYRTHRHAELSKPGVGEITICTSRLNGKTEVDVSTLQGGRDRFFTFKDVGRQELHCLVESQSPEELAQVCETLAEWRAL